MRKIFLIAGCTLIILSAFIGIVYYTQPVGVFSDNTYINGIDVSGKNAPQACEALREEWNSRTFTFRFDDGDRDVFLGEMKLKYDNIQEVQKKLINPGMIPLIRSFFHMRNDFEVNMHAKGSGKLLRTISQFPECDNANRTKTQDAYIDLSDTTFNVIKEVQGDEVDPERIEQKALGAISNSRFEKYIDLARVTKKADITAGSKEIKKQREYAKENLSFKITYNFGTEERVLTPAEINSMIHYPGKEIDEDNVERLVASLAAEYNEEGKDYNFTTHSGKIKKVHSNSFGRILDQSAEKDFLISALKKQKDKKRTPQWDKQPYKVSNVNDGIGDTYVEISIPKQHLWCFVDGEEVLSCNVVTGSIGHDTHTGVWVVDWKTRDTTLRGTNSDGSKYESFVNYFMPFNWYGEGMHDADRWRSVYGPSVSRYAGSHGCVNMPHKYAKKLYDIVEPGFPVVVY